MACTLPVPCGTVASSIPVPFTSVMVPTGTGVAPLAGSASTVYQPSALAGSSRWMTSRVGPVGLAGECRHPADPVPGADGDGRGLGVVGRSWGRCRSGRPPPRRGQRRPPERPPPWPAGASRVRRHRAARRRRGAVRGSGGSRPAEGGLLLGRHPIHDAVVEADRRIVLGGGEQQLVGDERASDSTSCWQAGQPSRWRRASARSSPDRIPSASSAATASTSEQDSRSRVAHPLGHATPSPCAPIGEADPVRHAAPIGEADPVGHTGAFGGPVPSATSAARSLLHPQPDPGLGGAERDALRLADLLGRPAAQGGEHERPALLRRAARPAPPSGGWRRRRPRPRRRAAIPGRCSRAPSLSKESGSTGLARRTRRASMARLRVMVSSHAGTEPRPVS